MKEGSTRQRIKTATSRYEIKRILQRAKDYDLSEVELERLERDAEARKKELGLTAGKHRKVSGLPPPVQVCSAESTYPASIHCQEKE